MGIAAIETRYHGYRFRSRLEARWAVYFETLRMKYLYEPEGFDLGNGLYYLPDFYLPDFDWYVEVKPDFPTGDDLKKIIEFSKHKHILLAEGMPEAKFYRAGHCMQQCGRLCKSDDCMPHALFAYDKTQLWRFEEWQPLEIQEILTNYTELPVMKAIEDARSARFEHGERGNEHAL